MKKLLVDQIKGIFCTLLEWNIIWVLTGYWFYAFAWNFTENSAGLKKHSPISNIIILYYIYTRKMKYTVYLPRGPASTKEKLPHQARKPEKVVHQCWSAEPKLEVMVRWLLWWWRLPIRISESDPLQTHESTLMAFQPFALWRLAQVVVEIAIPHYS